MNIDFTRPVETITGVPVQIITTQGPSADYPVVGLAGDKAETWNLEGTPRWWPREKYQLRQKSHTYHIVRWANLIQTEAGIVVYLFPNKGAADSVGLDNRIACVKIEFDAGHGEGLRQSVES